MVVLEFGGSCVDSTQGGVIERGTGVETLKYPGVCDVK